MFHFCCLVYFLFIFIFYSALCSADRCQSINQTPECIQLNRSLCSFHNLFYCEVLNFESWNNRENVKMFQRKAMSEDFHRHKHLE